MILLGKIVINVLSKVEGMSFLKLYRAGLVKAEDIDDYIDAWHDRKVEYKKEQPIYVFLGMTKRQYHEWVIRPEYLKELLHGDDSEKTC